MENIKRAIIFLSVILGVALLFFLAITGGEVEGIRGGILGEAGGSDPLAVSRLAQCQGSGVTSREGLAACIKSPQGMMDAINKVDNQ
jgi:hypothetical protein